MKRKASIKRAVARFLSAAFLFSSVFFGVTAMPVFANEGETVSESVSQGSGTVVESVVFTNAEIIQTVDTTSGSPSASPLHRSRW